jgi:hypothetical protein
MMVADPLRFIVPSGVSFGWPSPCRRACRASASAPHVAQHPTTLSTVQASWLERARPGAVAAFPGGAGCEQRSAAGPPTPGATAKGKGGRQDKRSRHMAA